MRGRPARRGIGVGAFTNVAARETITLAYRNVTWRTCGLLPRYQEEQQTVTAAWAGWGPWCPVWNFQPIDH